MFCGAQDTLILSNTLVYRQGNRNKVIVKFMVEPGLSPDFLSLSFSVPEFTLDRHRSPLSLQLSEWFKETMLLKNIFFDLFGSVFPFFTLSVTQRQIATE